MWNLPCLVTICDSLSLSVSSCLFLLTPPPSFNITRSHTKTNPRESPQLGMRQQDYSSITNSKDQEEENWWAIAFVQLFSFSFLFFLFNPHHCLGLSETWTLLSTYRTRVQYENSGSRASFTTGVDYGYSYNMLMIVQLRAPPREKIHISFQSEKSTFSAFICW